MNGAKNSAEKNRPILSTVKYVIVKNNTQVVRIFVIPLKSLRYKI